MIRVISYKTPQDYLNATEGFLLQNELENNLILGLCHGFAEKNKEYKNCVFINCIENDHIKSTSIKTWVRAIVSNTEDRAYIKPLAEYYLQQNIPLQGVFGVTTSAEQFAADYGKAAQEKVGLLVHRLTTVNPLPLANGTMVIATEDDLDLVTDWTMHFERDAHTTPLKTREQVLTSTKPRLRNGDIFKWMVHGEPVSIAAIVRRTKNIGIVGLVYTPRELRGKGYATSCVQKLSEQILMSGYTQCGLFTDKANPTSNEIYRKIGYEPVGEFEELRF